MQKLSEEDFNAAPEIETEMIPALYGTESYFALVKHNGKKILCILEGDTWRPVSYDEMMTMM